MPHMTINVSLHRQSFPGNRLCWHLRLDSKERTHTKRYPKEKQIGYSWKTIHTRNQSLGLNLNRSYFTLTAHESADDRAQLQYREQNKTLWRAIIKNTRITWRTCNKFTRDFDVLLARHEYQYVSWQQTEQHPQHQVHVAKSIFLENTHNIPR